MLGVKTMADKVITNLKGDEAQSRIEKALIAGQDAMGFEMQAQIQLGFYDFANPKPPIDSGQLRQNTQYKRKSALSGEIVADKDYAVHVEYGTTKMPARPFLRNGIAKGEESAGKKLVAELNKIKDLI